MIQNEVIVVEDLEKKYATPAGTVEALKDVSFSARRGEFICLLGPSGCGKSSLMMIVAGLRDKTGGTVTLNGRAVTGPVDQVGVVFQRDVLLDWRNVIENVLLQVECRHLRKQDYRDAALGLLNSVGLSGFEKNRPYELSGGMRQRVAICRALIHDPEMLLMDEPFGALDALTREQMMLDLQQLWLKGNKTVLFITHNITEAIFLSDRVLVMSPRPGTIDLDLPIDLPRPRSLMQTATPEFNEYVRTIRSTFESRGVIRDV